MIKTILIALFQLITFQLLAQSITTKSIDALFSHYNDQTPGLSILVTKNDNIVYKKSFGLSNMESRSLITSQTVFNTTSIAKQFIAFGIYLLESKQVLSLEDTIQLHLQNIPNYHKPITINHLLTHTSGLRDQRGLLTLAGYTMDDFISNDTIIQLIENQNHLNFEPGTQFEYNHTNYTLLAQIIESASGMNLNTFFKQYIFAPLSMENTFFLKNQNQSNNITTYSYASVDSIYTKVRLNYYNYGPTNLMSTIDDLSKWTKALFDEDFIHHPIIEKFNTIAKYKNGEKILAMNFEGDQIYVCKGQFYRNYKGHPFLSHGGALGGFRMMLGRFPNDNLTISLLGNDSSLNLYPDLLKIADIVLELPTDIPRSEEKIKAPQAETMSVPPTRKELNEYAGSYHNSELNSTYKFNVSGNHLNLVVGKLQVNDLSFQSRNRFNAEMDNIVSIEFVQENNLGFQKIKVKTTGVKEMVFYKVE
ncbi:MAG: serine hydrolase [Saprospiraceae bacterium]|nr:serine hydrolase [Saprospiraceae bacterium]